MLWTPFTNIFCGSINLFVAKRRHSLATVANQENFLALDQILYLEVQYMLRQQRYTDELDTCTS